MRLITLILVLLMVSCKNEPKDAAIASTKIDKSKQSFNLEIYDFEGLQKFLTTKSDTTYVVNFWATWCAPCVKELPYFEDLNKKYSGKNVKVILVSLDFPSKYDSNLKPYIKGHHIQSKVVALNDPDANTWIPKVSPDWSGSIPATLIFNKDKRHFYEQSFAYDELENEVKQFLK
ncbi:MAG: TlpA family protein disulfide reductase [Gelidibacter sp.]